MKKSSFVNRNFFWYTLFLKCKTFACLMIIYNESDIHAFIYQKPPQRLARNLKSKIVPIFFF